MVPRTLRTPGRAAEADARQATRVRNVRGGRSVHPLIVEEETKRCSQRRTPRSRSALTARAQQTWGSERVAEVGFAHGASR